MKIFVAGGTGVLGRRVVPRLVELGHSVSVLVRSEAKAEAVRRMGAVPVRSSLFDADGLRAAVAGHDVVVNVATHIPGPTKAANMANWAENDRIRTEGSRNLVDAALAAGATRFVQESLAFLYADGGDALLDEDAPLPEPVAATVATAVVAESQVQRFRDAGGAGVVLRFGFFHEIESDNQKAALAATRWGMAALATGPPGGYFPIIQVDDAAAAVVAALDAPSGTWNVTDDEPLTRADYAAAYDTVLGDPGQVRPPPLLIRRLVERKAPQMGWSQRVDNRRFKAATGWAPRHPSARETLAAMVRDAREPHRVRSGRVAALLVFLAFGSLVAGVWALVAPQSFYDSFPGFGRAWVSPDGPFNEHFIRDFGGLNLALAAVAVAAAASMTITLVRMAAVAHLLFGVPHLAYHVTHRHMFDAVDQISMLGALSLTVMAAAVVVWLSRPVASRRGSDKVRGTRTENQTQGRDHHGLRTPATALRD